MSTRDTEASQLKKLTIAVSMKTGYTNKCGLEKKHLYDSVGSSETFRFYELIKQFFTTAYFNYKTMNVSASLFIVTLMLNHSFSTNTTNYFEALKTSFCLCYDITNPLRQVVQCPVNSPSAEHTLNSLQ